MPTFLLLYDTSVTISAVILRRWVGLYREMGIGFEARTRAGLRNSYGTTSSSASVE